MITSSPTRALLTRNARLSTKSLLARSALSRLRHDLTSQKLAAISPNSTLILALSTSAKPSKHGASSGKLGRTPSEPLPLLSSRKATHGPPYLTMPSTLKSSLSSTAHLTPHSPTILILASPLKAISLSSLDYQLTGKQPSYVQSRNQPLRQSSMLYHAQAQRSSGG
jgi:hypothetical protein